MGNLSRRDFIRFNLALLALAGTSSCRWLDEPPDERTALRLMRAEDLLALTFEWRNLRIQHRGRQPARLVRIRENQEALLIVGFPGQHIFEQAYSESAKSGSIVLPARARIARPSRLVFKLPPERPYIDLTFDGLLGWGDWDPVWPLADRQEQTPAAAAEPSLVAMPYGLALSPEDAARWHHAAHPVTHDGRTELWHTRLLPQDSRQPLTVKILQPEPVAGDMTDITTALKEDDRQALSGRTARARTLILSPMGGWLDVRGSWQSDPTIGRWQQTVTAGQDQQVVIERAEGFLYPFGQRAALISVTERKLVKVGTNQSPEALLRQRDFIVIKQPDVAYTHGQMALSRMTDLDLVTPPLYNARHCDDGKCFFWIETGPGQAFPFRFRARDWAERPLFLEAPAIFVGKKARLSDVKALYEKEDIDPRRIAPLHGQAAAVVRFDSAVEGDTDRWGVPLENPRSVGDTTLYMLQIEFAGGDRTGPVAGAPPFDCRTKRMAVRLPSLEPYLDDAANRGWFTLVDPDPLENRGEVFARASDGDKIPMYFDRQADRSGGVAAPSFDVDGLSRVRGPVGDASREGPMYENGQFDPGRYFNPEHANLLGGFPLSQLLLTESGTRSPAVPAIHFSLSPKPIPKDAGKNARPQWEAGLGLSWRIGLKKYDIGPAHFVPDLDKQKRSKARLDIEARLTKTLGKPPAPEDQPPEAGMDEADGKAGPVDKENRPDESAPSSVSWQVSGKISDFAIALNTGALGHISIGFAHLGVTLGPPPPEKKKEPEAQKQKEDNPTQKKKLAAKIDYQMSEIKAKGVLLFLIKLIQMAADLPRIPDVDLGAPPSSAPSKLADVGDADLSVQVGPMALPTPAWKWLGKFEVTNLAVSLGVGLYFLPRQLKETEPPRVPDNLFTIRIASAAKPLTLMAEPWGGLAHVGFNFTPRGMTGFQSGLGIVYRAQFDLSGAQAKCEGSLTGIFTYQEKDDGQASHQVALVLKLNGQAVIAGFIDIHLTLMAAGLWDTDANRWSFSVEITVRIKISFFAVRARFRFSTTLSGGGRLADTAKTALPAADRLTESGWLAYRAAFVEEAFG